MVEPTTRAAPLASAHPQRRTGPRVALFGEFGLGNVGNDESCRVAVALLREAIPDARITIIGRDPRRTVELFGLPSVAITSGSWVSARPASVVARTLVRVAGKVSDFAHLVRIVRPFDLVLVPGTGMLDEPRRATPGGVVTWLLLLTTACRLRGVPLAWFSIGGGRYPHRLPALAAALAGRGATYRSYRDRITARALAGGGLRSAGDPVLHDLVYSRPEAVADPPQASATLRRVGISMINIDPAPQAGASAAALRASYVATLADVMGRLVADGVEVALLFGDEADVPITREAVELARAREPDTDRLVRWTEPGDLSSLLDHVAACDLVVASRFHVLIATTIMRRPPIALSHADKDHELMAQFGLSDYLRRVEGVAPEWVWERLHAAHDDRERVVDLLTAQCRRAHDRVRTEFGRMLAAVGLPDGGDAP